MEQVWMNSPSMLRNVVKFVSSVCRLSEAFTKTLLLAPTEHDWVVASNCKHKSPVYGSETHSVLSIALTNVWLEQLKLLTEDESCDRKVK